MVIAWKSGAPIRLQDIADVIDGLTDNRQLARFNGETTIGLGIVKVTNTNTVAIVDKVKDKLETNCARNSPACTAHIVSPTTPSSSSNRQRAEGTPDRGHHPRRARRLVFLRSLRSTLIISLAIPVSLIGAIAVIYSSVSRSAR